MTEWNKLVQIVDSDNRNNSVKFEKDSPFCFWVFQWQSLASRPLTSVAISISLIIGDGEISLNLFLIIIFIFPQLKIVYVCSLKFLWTTAIQNALLLNVN